jgi:hypothetical protein
MGWEENRWVWDGMEGERMGMGWDGKGTDGYGMGWTGNGAGMGWKGTSDRGMNRWEHKERLYGRRRGGGEKERGKGSVRLCLLLLIFLAGLSVKHKPFKDQRKDGCKI